MRYKESFLEIWCVLKAGGSCGRRNPDTVGEYEGHALQGQKEKEKLGRQRKSSSRPAMGFFLDLRVITTERFRAKGYERAVPGCRRAGPPQKKGEIKGGEKKMSASTEA